MISKKRIFVRFIRPLILPVLIFSIFVLIVLNFETVKGLIPQTTLTNYDFFYNCLQALLWLSFAYCFNKILKVFVWIPITKKSQAKSISGLTQNILTILVYLITVAGIVSFVFEQSVTGIWATSGIIGLVFGLALKPIILDICTGLAVNIEHPFEIGDWVTVHSDGNNHEITGLVEEVSWRATRIVTVEGNRVIVPNSMIGTSALTNFTKPKPQRRIDLFIALNTNIQPDRAKRILLAAAEAAVHESGGKVLAYPKPYVRVASIENYGVKYRISVYKHSHGPIMRSIDPVLHALIEHLHQAGVTIAYPKQDLFYTKLREREIDTESSSSRLRILKRVELFQGLKPTNIEDICKNLELIKAHAGDKIIEEGDTGDSMYVVVEGICTVFTHRTSSDTEIYVGAIQPGEFFGEMSMLTGEKRGATITADTDCLLYKIRKEHIGTIIKSEPEIIKHLSEVIAQRKLRTDSEFEKLQKTDAKRKQKTVAQQMLKNISKFFKL